MDRLAKDAEKRSRPAGSQVHEECTFQPSILNTSKFRKPRTVEEMSIGDSKKHEEKLVRACILMLLIEVNSCEKEAIKKKHEHESLVQATFQPRIIQYPTAQSRLKILSDPDSYHFFTCDLFYLFF